LVCAAVVLSMAGCARHREPPPSLKDVPAVIEKPVRAEKPEKIEKAETPEKDLRDWCAKRHVDRQQGRLPGGASDQEQIEADNRVCGEVYRYPGYRQP
jgi:hypothetical protein